MIPKEKYRSRSGKLTEKAHHVLVWLCFLLFGISTLVLIGWIFNIPVLYQILPGWPSLKPITAITFLFATILIYFLERVQVQEKKGLCFLYFSSTFLFLMAGFFLLARIFSIESPIQAPSAGTTLAFFFLSIAGLVSSFRKNYVLLYLIGSLEMGIGIISLLGYLLNIPFFYFSWRSLQEGTSLTTALSLILIGFILFIIAYSTPPTSSSKKNLIKKLIIVPRQYQSFIFAVAYLAAAITIMFLQISATFRDNEQLRTEILIPSTKALELTTSIRYYTMETARSTLEFISSPEQNPDHSQSGVVSKLNDLQQQQETAVILLQQINSQDRNHLFVPLLNEFIEKAQEINRRRAELIRLISGPEGNGDLILQNYEDEFEPWQKEIVQASWKFTDQLFKNIVLFTEDVAQQEKNTFSILILFITVLVISVVITILYLNSLDGFE